MAVFSLKRRTPNKWLVRIGSVHSESTYVVVVKAKPSARLAIIDATTNEAYTRLRIEMLVVAMVPDDGG